MPVAGDMVTGSGVYMFIRMKIPALVPLIAALSACAGGDGRYPSLAMRAFETAPPVSAPAAPTAPIRPVADAAMLSALVARANTAHTRFTGQEPAAARLAQAAAGRSIESDRRAAALVAMADLAVQRGATSAVLADLDQLAVEASISFAPGAEIDAARAEVLALVARQDAAIARLWETMGQ